MPLSASNVYAKAQAQGRSTVNLTADNMNWAVGIFFTFATPAN